MQTTKALGMIEVRGRLGDIEALDAALKAANVHLLNMTKVGGGLTTIFVEGDVAAVKAAVSAGGAAADKVSEVVSVHVIPRPDPSVRALLNGGYLQEFATTDPGTPSRGEKMKAAKAAAAKAAEKPTAATAEKAVPAAQKAEPKAPVAKAVETEAPQAAPAKPTAPQTAPKEPASAGNLASLKVNDLRRMARGIPDFPMTREEIKFAKKDALIAALSKFTQGGTD